MGRTDPPSKKIRCVATQYTHLLIFLLYGAKYADGTEAPYLLAWYCAYVAVMACNGTTEAFVQAVTDEGESAKFNLWLFACSCGFLMLALVLVPRMGTSGLVLGNCLVMSGRIVFNIWYAKTRRNSNAKFFPHPVVLLSFLLALGLARASNVHLYPFAAGEKHEASLLEFLLKSLPHVAVGVLLVVVLALVVRRNDEEMMTFIKQGGRIGEEEATPSSTVSEEVNNKKTN